MEEPLSSPSFSTTINSYISKREKAPKLTHYNVLELDTHCQPSEVRRAYYHFAKIFHPDKTGNTKHAYLLNEIKLAYEVLSNEYQRLLYDILNGLYKKDDIHEKLIAIADVMKQKYYTFLEEKADLYLQSINQEFTENGLIIRRALYGNLSLLDGSEISSSSTIDTSHLRGPFIDVTVQLQVLVQNSVLHLNLGNVSSFAYLPGFYNPLDFEQSEEDNEAQLYVLYLFRNNVHEVTVSDSKSLSLPMKSHLTYGGYIKGPFAISNLDTLSFISNTCTYKV